MSVQAKLAVAISLLLGVISGVNIRLASDRKHEVSLQKEQIKDLNRLQEMREQAAHDMMMLVSEFPDSYVQDAEQRDMTLRMFQEIASAQSPRELGACLKYSLAMLDVPGDISREERDRKAKSALEIVARWRTFYQEADLLHLPRLAWKD